MEGSVNSLNVSCAASIIMWEVYKNGDFCHKTYPPKMIWLTGLYGSIKNKAFLD
jgi:hypothetical protein